MPSRANALRRKQVARSSAVLVLAAGIGFALLWHPRSAAPASVGTLSQVLELPPEQLSRLSVARANLLCASGLSPTDPDIAFAEETIRCWATRAQAETQRHQYRYQRNPAEYENSEGFFKMLMLAVVLAEDYSIRYDASRRAGPQSSRADDRFFADPSAVFLHGLLGPERSGTCSSMPVLYVAIGRELGYPLKLVTTKGHLFVRWEGQRERFNLEVTSQGLNRYDDEYYRHWPFAVSPGEEAAEGYLKSLTPTEELAVFLSIRAMCQIEARRSADAAETFAAAARLAPGCASYQRMASSLRSQTTTASVHHVRK